MTAPDPDDLFESADLDDALSHLLGPELDAVVAAAGNRAALHAAERRWAKAAVDALSLSLHVVGLDRVDPRRTYVVAPLHEGFADVLALLQLPLDLNWVIRDELLQLPLFGTYLQAAGHIAVEPEAPRAALRAMLRGADDTFGRGESLVVFPQGSILGIETMFLPGAFQLAARFDVPVLPVVLTGSHRVWEYPFATTLRRHQRIHMEVLEAISPEAAVAGMRTLEREMKRRALRVRNAPVRHYVPERDGTWDGYRFVLDTEPLGSDG